MTQEETNQHLHHWVTTPMWYHHRSLVYTFIIQFDLSFVNVQNKQMCFRKVVQFAQGFVVAKVFCKDINQSKLGPCQLTAALRLVKCSQWGRGIIREKIFLRFENGYALSKTPTKSIFNSRTR